MGFKAIAGARPVLVSPVNEVGARSAKKINRWWSPFTAGNALIRTALTHTHTPKDPPTHGSCWFEVWIRETSFTELLGLIRVVPRLSSDARHHTRSLARLINKWLLLLAVSESRVSSHSFERYALSGDSVALIYAPFAETASRHTVVASLVNQNVDASDPVKGPAALTTRSLCRGSVSLLLREPRALLIFRGGNIININSYTSCTHVHFVGGRNRRTARPESHPGQSILAILRGVASSRAKRQANVVS